MSISKQIYNVFYRRSSSYVFGIFAFGFAFELGFDAISDRVWDTLNHGRQWKDIRHKYIEQ
ncbi:cytochrome b-c1 complex subunit 9 [Polychytrium aggregatum]|uniref:cytochrome b-c1 complex subunit 9 n=1 Tax=Polychytrium aggregatum TaxID=110093 RepID=UPI0022FDF775|nr:cytochrome b-c1 complex subunit 9 [Polychytrium aggregatum]KAI9202938.1 cytochrome b-c1 complex subunit 9 [Polychytrium aggregatum]